MAKSSFYSTNPSTVEQTLGQESFAGALAAKVAAEAAAEQAEAFAASASTAVATVLAASDDANDAAVEAEEAADRAELSANTAVQALADVNGALALKADLDHTHVIANVSGLQAILDGKSPVTHSHSIANVVGLQAALDGKLMSGANAVVGTLDVTAGDLAVTGWNGISDQGVIFLGSTGLNYLYFDGTSYNFTNSTLKNKGLDVVLADDARLTDARTPTSHGHSIADITSLQGTLDDKITSNSNAVLHILEVNSGDLKVKGWNGDGAQGTIFFGNTGTAYLYFDGSAYNMPGGSLFVNGQPVVLDNDARLTGGGGGGVGGANTALTGATTIEQLTLSGYSWQGRIGNSFCTAINATWDGTNWNRIDETGTAWLTQINVTDSMIYENYQARTEWTCQPGSNPITGFTTVGGWKMGTSLSEYSDFTIAGNGIEIDGNYIAPYGRLQNHVQAGPIHQLGLLTNAYLDLSDVDNDAYPSWFAGFHNYQSTSTDEFVIRRAGTAGSLSFTNLLRLSNDGTLQLVQTPTVNGTAVVLTNDSRLSDARTPVAHNQAISTITGLQTALDGKAATTHAHAISDTTGLQAALDTKASTTHGHAIADVTGLQTALDGKAASTHAHAIADTTGLQAALDAKAATTHGHAIADVTGLQTALDSKAASTHTHAISDTTGLQTALDGKAASTHSHAIADTTGLQTALDAKAPLASPALTGTPTAPTATGGTNTTQIATTAFVASAISGLSGGGGISGNNTALTGDTTIEKVNIGGYSWHGRVNNSYYTGINVVWTGTVWNRIDTSAVAWLWQYNVTDTMVYESYQGVTLWVAQPGTNPVGDFTGVGGWKMVQSNSEYSDFTLAGNGIEIDANYVAPYGRLQNYVQGGPVHQLGLLTNAYLDLSGVDTTSSPSWFAGFHNFQSASTDKFVIRRAPTSGSTTFTDLLTVTNAGVLQLAATPTVSGTALVLTNDSRLSDARTPTTHSHAIADVTGLQTALDAKAALASPTFTGTPAAPTATAGANTTQLATTAFVTAAANLKANLASPTFTGTPAAPTASAGTSTTQLATTAFVTTADNLKANLASPTFTGTVTLPLYKETVNARGSISGAQTIDLSLGTVVTATITTTTTFTITNTPAATSGVSFVLVLTNGGAGAITWPTSVKWPGGTAPTLTASGRDRIFFMTHDGGTTWDANALKDFK